MFTDFNLTGSSLPKLPTGEATTEGRGVPVTKEPDDVSRSLPNISTPDTSGSEQVVPSMKPCEYKIGSSFEDVSYTTIGGECLRGSVISGF